MDKENIKQTNKKLLVAAVILLFLALYVSIISAVVSTWSLNEENINNTAEVNNATGDTNTSIKESPDTASKDLDSGNEKVEEVEPLPTQNAAGSGSGCGGSCGSPTCGAAQGEGCGCGR